MQNTVPVVWRRSWKSYTVLILIFSIPFVATTVIDALLGGTIGRDRRVAFAIMSATAVLVRYWQRTIVTSEGISICWFIERNVAWSQISAITLDRELGERFITLHVSGKKRPLPAPRTIFRIGVREVEDAYHLVTQTWLKLRGPEWQPPAAPQWNPWGAPPPTDEAHG